MSLLLKALAQINTRLPADDLATAEAIPAAPGIIEGAIELPLQIESPQASPNESEQHAATIESLPEPTIEKIGADPAENPLDSTTTLAGEFDSEILAQSEDAIPDSAIISEASAVQELSRIESSLQRLSDLCQAIDADVSQPAVALPEPTPPVQAAPLPPLPAPLPQVVVVKSPPTVYVPTVKVRDEIRILKESIAARLPLTGHATLLFVDGGRTAIDAAWLWAFAACILNDGSNQQDSNAETASGSDSSGVGLPKTAPKILIVEAADSESGIASAIGLDAGVGLSDVLNGTNSLRTAIQESHHPQIRFLCRGSDPLRPNQAESLAKLWTALSSDFDLLLVAGGPLNDNALDESVASSSAAEMFLPLAGGVVVCVELDGTPAAVCFKTKATLEATGVALLGCVVRGEIAA